MWDISKPIKMLKVLRCDSASLQHIIDVDKYIASSDEGYDICQNYMQYCAFCNKSVKNPCASAYLVGNHYMSVCQMIDRTGIMETSVIQAITDVDKYIISMTVNYDICGKYAPFCKMCNKNDVNPCATAYLKYSTGRVEEPVDRGQTDVAAEVAATTDSDEFAEEFVYGEQSVEEVADIYEPEEVEEELTYGEQSVEEVADIYEPEEVEEELTYEPEQSVEEVADMYEPEEVEEELTYEPEEDSEEVADIYWTEEVVEELDYEPEEDSEEVEPEQSADDDSVTTPKRHLGIKIATIRRRLTKNL